MKVMPLIDDAWCVLKRLRTGRARVLDVADCQVLSLMIKHAIDHGLIEDENPTMVEFLGREIINELEAYTQGLVA